MIKNIPFTIMFYLPSKAFQLDSCHVLGGCSVQNSHISLPLLVGSTGWGAMTYPDSNQPGLVATQAQCIVKEACTCLWFQTWLLSTIDWNSCTIWVNVNNTLQGPIYVFDLSQPLYTLQILPPTGWQLSIKHNFTAMLTWRLCFFSFFIFLQT